MAMRAYPHYRDSGVEWLGGVPEHWVVKGLKYVASTNDEALTHGKDPLRPISYVDIGSVDATRGIVQTEELVFEDAPSRARRLVRDGDTIVSTVRTYLRAIAAIHSPAAEVVVSTGFAVIRPFNLDPGFCSWALRENGFVDEVVARSVGVSYPAINASQIGELPVPLPPLNEQRGISEFLDRETKRIDALVEKKRLLIERLEEYRTALITRTVTRGLPPEAARAAGLDPSPRLKASGVEWLGDVPEHWQLKRLGRIGSFTKGSGGTKEDEVEEGIPCIRYGDLYTKHQFCIRNSRTGISEDRTASYTPVQFGDILFAGSGETIDEIGKSAVSLIRGRAYCGGDVIIFRPSIDADAAFLGYAADCSASAYQKACMGKGVTVMHIYSSELKSMVVPIPPVSEQRAIGAFLERATERIEMLRDSIQAKIERLGEYRSAIITAAVTGKIDVREQTTYEQTGAGGAP